MRIKKTSATTSLQAQVVNTYNTSDSDTYSCEYINGVELYSGSSTSGNITLSDNISNYAKVDIVTYNRTNTYETYTLYNPSEKKIEVKTADAEAGLGDYYIYSSTVLSFSGTNVTRNNNKVITIRNEQTTLIGTDISYYILGIAKIIGYK